jgi:hypothetical protein
MNAPNNNNGNSDFNKNISLKMSGLPWPLNKARVHVLSLPPFKVGWLLFELNNVPNSCFLRAAFSYSNNENAPGTMNMAFDLPKNYISETKDIPVDYTIWKDFYTGGANWNTSIELGLASAIRSAKWRLACKYPQYAHQINS